MHCVTRFCLSIYTLSAHKSEIDCKHYPFRSSHFNGSPPPLPSRLPSATTFSSVSLDPIYRSTVSITSVRIVNDVYQIHTMTVFMCDFNARIKSDGKSIAPLRLNGIAFEFPWKKGIRFRHTQTQQVAICSRLKFLIKIHVPGIKALDKCFDDARHYFLRSFNGSDSHIFQLLESPSTVPWRVSAQSCTVCVANDSHSGGFLSNAMPSERIFVHGRGRRVPGRRVPGRVEQ